MSKDTATVDELLGFLCTQQAHNLIRESKVVWLEAALEKEGIVLIG